MVVACALSARGVSASAGSGISDYANPDEVGAIAATAALPATRVAQADPRTLKEGQDLLAEKCGRCHAIGRGDASRDPKAPPFRTLSKRYPIEALEEALGEGIISGHPDMPEFEFDSDDVGAIVAYLKSIQDKR